MICVADLQKLTDSWQKRMGNPAYPSAYIDALSECIYDVQQLIASSIEDELSYQDVFGNTVKQVSHATRLLS